MKRLMRREFLSETGQAVAAAAVAVAALSTEDTRPALAKSRVVVVRHPALADAAGPDPRAVRGALDQAALALSGESDLDGAWARWFKPQDRVAMKVNCLGLATHPAVVAGLAQSLGAAEIAPERTIVWDRSDHELVRAGYTLRKRGSGMRCYGTDGLGGSGPGGYDTELATSGAIGSLYSRIITERCDALVSVPVLKDHNLAGLTCALKNFFGAIHNPNKYHDNGCTPFVADVCAHEHIRNRLRLAVCDATQPQYNGGPPRRQRWQWPYGGLILSTDVVALDRVALEILERKRAVVGLRPLAAEQRPVRYLESAAARNLGKADLADIEIISIGTDWLDVG
ncbi:MAG: DUF362 domain-containing protein [Gemmatimonadota bacterium]|nr:MAG: DUF362 domain-containing protein [Gemmatimonadota bacterium]